MPMNEVQTRRTWLRRLGVISLHAIGPVLLVLILTRLDWAKLLAEARTISGWAFVAGLACLGVLYICKSLRFVLMCRALGGRITFWSALKIYLTAVLLSFITPGRVGDFAKVLFLHRSKILALEKAFVATLADRVWDMLVIAGLGTLALSLAFSGMSVLHGLLCAAIIAAAVLFFIPEVWRAPVSAVIKRVPPLERRLYQRVVTIAQAVKLVRNSTGLIALVLSLVAFCALVTIAWVLTRATGNQLAPAYCAGGVAMASILAYLPITVAGAGTREAAFIVFWGLGGLGENVAVLVSLGFFVVVYLGSSVMGCAAYFLYTRSVLKTTDLASVAGTPSPAAAPK
jgi:uncharacterized protein (TIRG00374 family)